MGYAFARERLGAGLDSTRAGCGKHGSQQKGRGSDARRPSFAIREACESLRGVNDPRKDIAGWSPEIPEISKSVPAAGRMAGLTHFRKNLCEH
jgi:hypothetical protein